MMHVRTEDYRPYEKTYHGRPYRIYRIYTNNLHSIMTNKWSIMVIVISFLFLFFSVLGIVFSAPLEDIEESMYIIEGPDVNFDILPKTDEDLHHYTYLNDTFQVTYEITNVGTNTTDPIIFILPPNMKWDIQWELEKETLGPGESMDVIVTVHVPDNISHFIQFDSSGSNEYDDEYSYTQERDGASLPYPGGIDDGLTGFTSPEQLFIGSVLLDNIFSRLMMVFAVPDDVDLFSSIRTGMVELDPRISSLATVISLYKDEPDLHALSPVNVTSMDFDTSFELIITEAEEDIHRISMRSRDSYDLNVIVKNTGDRPIRVKLEAYEMPINDWDWSMEVYPQLDHENNPEGDILPGEEMVYEVRIFSGFLSSEMPYNIVLIGTETTMWEYKESRAELIVVDITGPRDSNKLQQQFFDTFWGGEFNYERFLWIVLLTAVAGSGLISRDLKNNTFTLYFSRPLTWIDYALGKFLALATTLSLITVVPVILIFATKMAFLDEPFSYVIENIPVLGGMILSYLIAIVFFSSVALALSSMTKRGVFAGVGIFAYLVMAPIISDLLVAIFDNDHLKLFNVNLVLRSMFLPFFGLEYSGSTMGFGYHLLVLEVLAIISICWGILFFRFHNKEVAK